jgi:hypothetical protein
MLIGEKEGTFENVGSLPPILCLNKGGEPLGWINYEDSATYYAKGKVLWSLGTHEVMLRGGTNAKTGKQSILVMDTIIAVANDSSPSKYRSRDPRLSNKTLFERDKNMCAYCGSLHSRHALTRDHVMPTSKGGKDVWENVVTSCIGCNQYKSDMTPEQAGLKLLYVPYTPTYNEHLILQNRRILADQMEFLMAGVSKHSRLHLT